MLSSCLRSDAFILAYDVTNPSSLDGLEYFVNLLDDEANRRLDDGNTMVPVILVVANQCDRRRQRKVSSEQGLSWASQHGCAYMETSAKKMIGVEESVGREWQHAI